MPRESNNNTALKDRIKELESEVSKLQKDLDKRQKKSIWDFLRKLLIVLLIILTALFINFSIVALYVRRNIVNSDVWVNKTTQIIKTPSVRQDISDALAKRIFSKTDAQANIKQILPDKVSVLSVPLTNTLQNYTSDQINKIMQSEQFIQFWQNSTRSAHSGIIDSLQSEGNGQPDNNLLYIQNENLYLNLQPVFDNIKSKLSDRGLSFVNNVNLKGVQKTLPIAHIKNMQTVLGAFNALNKMAILTPLLALIFLVGALILSTKKRSVIIAIAMMTILLMLLNVQLLYLAKYPFVSSINNALASSSNSSAQSIYGILTNNLILFDRLVMAVMLLVILIAYFTGPYNFAKLTRKRTAALFKHIANSNLLKWLGKNKILSLSVSAIIFTLLLVLLPAEGIVFTVVIIVIELLFVFLVLSQNSARGS